MSAQLKDGDDGSDGIISSFRGERPTQWRNEQQLRAVCVWMALGMADPDSEMTAQWVEDRAERLFSYIKDGPRREVVKLERADK